MSNPTSTSLQGTYDTNAAQYDQFLTLPLGILEQQLFTQCITNCQGQKVLDLGGGTGARARDALAAGAASVDVVDISPEMMRRGQQIEESILSRQSDGQAARGKLNWIQADLSQPLIDHLDLEPGTYDTVIANGIFDHAHTITELETMWSNAATYCKPGGRLIANRNNPLARSAQSGKYGVRLTDFKPLPGGDGVSFRYRMATEPELVFNSTALEVYYRDGWEGEWDVPKRWFGGFENVDWRETEVVQKDREFWGEWLEDPLLFVFTARRLDS